MDLHLIQKTLEGGISATSIHLQARNPDYIRNATGALRADYYIDTRNLDVTYKEKTKGRLPDWKIRSSLKFYSKAIVGHGKVSKC